MTEQDRLKRYLDDLHPRVKELRALGWPAEAYVQNDDGKLVVWCKCDLHDVRVPEETGVEPGR